MKRLSLSDISGRFINIEYEIDDFEKLRKLILQNIPHQRIYGSSVKVFRRFYSQIILISACGLFSAVLAVLSYRDGAVISRATIKKCVNR